MGDIAYFAKLAKKSDYAYHLVVNDKFIHTASEIRNTPDQTTRTDTIKGDYSSRLCDSCASSKKAKLYADRGEYNSSSFRYYGHRWTIKKAFIKANSWPTDGSVCRTCGHVYEMPAKDWPYCPKCGSKRQLYVSGSITFFVYSEDIKKLEGKIQTALDRVSTITGSTVTLNVEM